VIFTIIHVFADRDRFAAKAAGHDLRSSGQLLSASVKLPNADLRICVPMQVAIDYCGFRALAMPLLPLGEGSLVHGSSDGGKTVHASDQGVNNTMKALMGALHLAPHHVAGVEVI
jgi:hypothetical protein